MDPWRSSRPTLLGVEGQAVFEPTLAVRLDQRGHQGLGCRSAQHPQDGRADVGRGAADLRPVQSRAPPLSGRRPRRLPHDGRGGRGFAPASGRRRAVSGRPFPRHRGILARPRGRAESLRWHELPPWRVLPHGLLRRRLLRLVLGAPLAGRMPISSSRRCSPARGLSVVGIPRDRHHRGRDCHAGHGCVRGRRSGRPRACPDAL